VLIIALTVTAGEWLHQKNQSRVESQTRFERDSRIVKDDLIATLNAYGLFLRGGVGLFHASNAVNRAEWRQYVSDLNLKENYPGIQGVSFNAVLRSQEELTEFVETVRKDDWSDYTIKPEGMRALYSPVLFLEPLNSRNEKALGFDIYSEENRRLAVDRAITTGQPAVTSKIRLVQENANNGSEKVQAGVLVILPVYDQDAELSSAAARRAAAQGLIVSVFRIGDLVEGIIKKPTIGATDLVAVRLFDSDEPNAQSAMFDNFDHNERDISSASFYTNSSIEIFGRSWTFQTVSTPQFEAQAASHTANIVLVAGILVSLLLTSLTWGQALRAHENKAAALRTTQSQKQIELLMGEVNHRSKNLLGLVQAIARQTSRSGTTDFMAHFSKRLSALAASQDLLVKNKWQGINLNDLLTSQLAHFEHLIGTRIVFDGPNIEVNSQAAQAIGMATHELATNAEKYGSLSNETGKVMIDWTIEDTFGEPTRFKLCWQELGGPAVTAPSSTGFGSKVIGMMVKSALKANVETRFEQEGFKWILTCPHSEVIEFNDLIRPLEQAA
jgi:two-component sensor histidine kinase